MRREYQVVGRQGSAALRQFLAREGPAHPGRPDGAIRRHGEQGGIVALGGQKVRVSKPRLRRKGGGEGAEVAVPAYAAMQSDESLRERMLSIVMRGVSTRHYQEVVPELAERCGVSRSAVSRQLQEASAQALVSQLETPSNFGNNMVRFVVGTAEAYAYTDFRLGQ